MKNSKISAGAFTLAALALAGGGFSANAGTVDLTLTSYPTQTLSETGFGGYVPDGHGGQEVGIVGDDLIGLYKFAVANSLSTTLVNGSVLVSTCLSPVGNLDWSTHNYTTEDFGTASPGLHPNAWSPQGIYNAAYLWRHWSGTVTTRDQGAALMLSLWDVLYNSVDYGQLTSATTGFGTGGGATAAAVSAGTASGYKITSWGGTVIGGVNQVEANYDLYMSALSLSTIDNRTSGNVLVDTAYATGTGAGGTGRRNTGETSPGAGQEFMFNTTPIPEPSTLIAGALLLLPFGASTVRFMRKNKTA